jgi:hypothetical protein
MAMGNALRGAVHAGLEMLKRNEDAPREMLPQRTGKEKENGSK